MTYMDDKGGIDVSQDEVKKLYESLNKKAEESGYHLNRDLKFTNDLIRGLIINEKRYGYRACPCRIASGIKEEDLDIICPCYYRDPDLDEYGMCYCSLYVSGDVLNGKKNIEPIPERRSPEEEEEVDKSNSKKGFTPGDISGLSLPVYRYKVCGYLCARKQPPGVCPICKSKKERFERFI